MGRTRLPLQLPLIIFTIYMQITRGLLQKYGHERVRDTPITEVRIHEQQLEVTHGIQYSSCKPRCNGGGNKMAVGLREAVAVQRRVRGAAVAQPQECGRTSVDSLHSPVFTAAGRRKPEASPLQANEQHCQ